MDGHDEAYDGSSTGRPRRSPRPGWTSSGLERIVEMVGPNRGEQVLDVAAAAGHLGSGVAPSVMCSTAPSMTW
jgi:hypothetical protein